MATDTPRSGETIRVLLPGRKRSVEYVVIDQLVAIDGAIRAARPSRKSVGDYFGGIHTLLIDWIV